MPFNDKQSSFESLRNIISERTSSLVVWVGSGPSSSVGIDSWLGIKNRLIDVLGPQVLDLEESVEKNRRLGLLKSAKEHESYWVSFNILKSLAKTSYTQTIKESFRCSETCLVPVVYKKIWKLNPRGVLTLNLDRLLVRAFNEVNPGKIGNRFCGKHSGNNMHLLQGTRPFIGALHGEVEDVNTWVLTKDELDEIINQDGYKMFINSIFLNNIVLFVGISADDLAIGSFLENLKEQNISSEAHFWVTDRKDVKTLDWAENAGIRIINYKSSEGSHVELEEFFDSLLSYVSVDRENYPPAFITGPEETILDLPKPQEMLIKDVEEIRFMLNDYAKNLLSKNSGVVTEEYNEFLKEYDQVIHRAWYTDVTDGRNELMGYHLIEKIAEGAFGNIYKAIDRGNQVAIKVLLDNIRNKPEFINCFRRGVNSMRILEENRVDGVVTYKEASEIPAFVVMEWIEGASLKQAVEARQIDNWNDILFIAGEICRIIHNAHKLSERVLHRDIRPANIMLKHFYSPDSEWSVQILDFDLSWHKGAWEKSIVHGPVGFLAPEQIRDIKGVSTRHAAVDSYGLGMTLYFMISKIEPDPNMHKQTDWDKTVFTEANTVPAGKWKSIPHRFCRLIVNATKDRQSHRWDISQIHNEINRLFRANNEREKVKYAELVAEEICCNSMYEMFFEWNDDVLGSIGEFENGLKLKIIGNESRGYIQINGEWGSRGYTERKKEKKKIETYIKIIDEIMNKSMWKEVETRQGHNLLTFSAVVSVDNAVDNIKELGKSIDKCIEIFGRD